VENLGDKTAPRLMLLFHEYPQPVVFPEAPPIFDIPLPDPPAPTERKKLKKIVNKGNYNTHTPQTLSLWHTSDIHSPTLCLSPPISQDPLFQLSVGDKKLLWKYRGWLRSVSVSSLVKLLQSVPWTNPTAVREVHGLIALWGPIRPVDALEVNKKTIRIF